jgi:hypothetical protein
MRSRIDIPWSANDHEWLQRRRNDAAALAIMFGLLFHFLPAPRLADGHTHYAFAHQLEQQGHYQDALEEHGEALQRFDAPADKRLVEESMLRTLQKAGYTEAQAKAAFATGKRP